MATPETLAGIHHVTAITADPQKNVDFYCGVLGLRLVKLTVNFDDPGSYHLYYGDELGRPGTIMTFFAWPGAHRGRIGPPQVTVTAFAVPMGSLDYWKTRLTDNRVASRDAENHFGQRGLAFEDPDGMPLEIVGEPDPAGQAWTSGPVPANSAIRGFHGVTIAEEGYEKTAHLLTDLMGFKAVGEERNRFRYRAASDKGVGLIVDLLCVPGARHGAMGAGVIHHIAFRTADDPQQKHWQEKIAGAGLNVSPVMDRTYFHSIYYREPGGVLFEIATDAPGFTFDEPAEQLGTKLKLPPWLQPHQAEIEQAVPPLRLPRPDDR
jgi:glyoxalase family protein